MRTKLISLFILMAAALLAQLDGAARNELAFGLGGIPALSRSDTTRLEGGFRHSIFSGAPKGFYVNRRRFLARVVGALGLARGVSAATKLSAVKSPLSTNQKPTPYQDVTTYNNFYEFGTSKSDPAHNARNFRTVPWSISIEGAVAKPQVLDLDALLKIAPF